MRCQTSGLLQRLNYVLSKRSNASMTIEADIRKIVAEYPEIRPIEVGYK